MADIRTTDSPALKWRASQSGSSDSGARNQRWLAVWITLALLVLLVVIGFLIAISNALVSIDDALAVADEAVTGAGGDVTPLPGQVSMVNTTLGSIDTELKPIPGQADQIIAALASIRDSLVRVDGSLKDTSGSLVDTSGSLVNTSGVLARVRQLAADIEGVLEAAEAPGDNSGASDIFMRVDTANTVLAPARADLVNINDSLTQVNGHLDSICNAVPLGARC